MPSRHHKRFEPLKPAPKRLSNPYFRSSRSDKLSSSRVKKALFRLTPRVWAYIFIFILLVGGLVWLLAFSNIFVLKAIDVNGVPDEDKLAFESLAWEQSMRNRAWLFPQSRLAVFNSQALTERIETDYALAGVRVIKKLPSTLQIKITEKTPAATWFEADMYYLVDQEGWVIRGLPTPNPELPVIYNNGETRLAGKQVGNAGEPIAAATTLFNEFKGRFSNIKYRQLVVDTNRHTITVVLDKGQLIYLATNQSLSGQLDRFDLLLKDQLKDQLPKLKYVDLRYGDKIYYK